MIFISISEYTLFVTLSYDITNYQCCLLIPRSGRTLHVTVTYKLFSRNTDDRRLVYDQEMPKKISLPSFRYIKFHFVPRHVDKVKRCLNISFFFFFCLSLEPQKPRRKFPFKEMHMGREMCLNKNNHVSG